MIARYLGQPVFDSTGMKGLYDLDLKWDHVVTTPGEPDPSIFSAVTAQLGLKLVPEKRMLDYLVVDSALKVPREP